MLCPSSFSATAFASCLSSRLRASMSARWRLEALAIGLRGAQGLLARQEEIAREPVLDAHDVADLAELGDPFEQNDFHVVSPSKRSALKRRFSEGRGRGTGERAGTQRQRHLGEAEQREAESIQGSATTISA